MILKVNNRELFKAAAKYLQQANSVRNKYVLSSPLSAPTAQNKALKSSNSSSNESEKDTNLKTRLFASVCIERMPVITCDANDLEKRYLNLINELNIRNSYLSDHELRHRKDLERQHKRDKTKVQEDDLLIETALDFEEKCLKELNAIKLGERRLGSDFDKLPKIDDTKTKFRNFDYVLDKKLILLVYEPDTSKWQLPKLEWSQNDVSLRMTAEKAIRNLDDKLQVDFLGNAPFGVYKSKKDNSYLDKQYFFKAQYKSGAESLAKSKIDYVWIRKDELKEFITDQPYLQCLMNFILDF